jgi:hypothetical protein
VRFRFLVGKTILSPEHFMLNGTMWKRTIFAPSGQGRFERGLSGDQRGVTPVIGAVLVIGLVIIAMSVYLRQVTPSYLRYNEAEHYNAVRSVFLELQRMIFSNDSGTIDIPMSSEPTPIFTLPPTSSMVEVTPARWVKRFQPTADTYVDENAPDSNFGGDNVLSVRSYKTGRNRRIYIKFDVAAELPGVDAEDVAEAWVVLYCENITKFTGAPWGIPAYDPATNPDGDNFYLPDLPIRVEAREVTGTWTEDGLTWYGQSSLTIGDTIKAGDWPYDDNHGVKDNEVWFTWDVTSWVRNRLRARDNVSILLKACYENSSQDRTANFSSKERVGLRVTEPSDFTDSDEANKKTTGHPPYLKPHLTVIYENGNLPGPPVYDNWGAFIEGGSVRFDTKYMEFPSHSFIFESGALLQQQYGYAYGFMISDPGLVVGERLDDDVYHDNIAVYVNRYRVVNWDRVTTSADTKLIVRVWENTDYRRELHLDNVLITVRSGFEWPWKYYFRDLTFRWNTSMNKGGLQWWADYYYGRVEPGESFWSGNVVEFMAKLYVDRNIRLYTWGRVENVGVNDIFYYDRTYDVEVQVGV